MTQAFDFTIYMNKVILIISRASNRKSIKSQKERNIDVKELIVKTSNSPCNLLQNTPLASRFPFSKRDSESASQESL